MKPNYSLYTLLFFTWPVSDAFLHLTPTMIKFLIMGVIVPPVALYMLYQDPNSNTPSFWDAVATFFTSLIFVWLGYEVSVETKIPVVFGLIGTFFIGLSSLPVILKAKKHLVDLVGTIIDSLGDWFKKFTNK